MLTSINKLMSLKLSKDATPRTQAVYQILKRYLQK